MPSRPLALLLLVSLAPLGCGEDGPAAPDDGMPGDAIQCSNAPGWSIAPPILGGPIQETAAVALDAKVYVIGGFNAARGVVRSVRVFDTTTCSWSDGPDLPRAVHHANAAVHGGTIYVLGSMEALSFTPIGDVWAWNPTTDATWTARASMPAGTERGSAVVGVIDDRIYLAGGLRSQAVAMVSSYSPSLDTWDTTLPALPQPRDHGCGAAVGGKLYVLGGRQGSPASRSDLTFELLPGGAWTQRMSMPTARGGTGCGVVNERIIVVGGEGNPDNPSGVFSEVEAYSPANDVWESLAPMLTPRHGMGAAAVGPTLHVPGGASVELFGAVDAHETLRP